ncbi:MAG: hypothetical protein KDD03_03080 [Gelidibacter sp.]|nr:hypothetical protein [Gelidibacter sp.]
MQIKRVLIIVLILLSVVFIGLQFTQHEAQADGVEALLFVFLTSLYCYKVKQRQVFFFLFLLFFTLAQVLNFASYYINYKFDAEGFYSYYLINSVYILAYLFLIIRILSNMNLKEVIMKFPFHIVVLLILDVFCVTIITGTTENLLTKSEYSMEYVYNTIIMILLTVALMNYISKDDKKSMNLLLGSIFIVFSEIIQLAYFYISDINSLNVLCSLFLIIAFVFFYLQSRIPFDNKKELITT